MKKGVICIAHRGASGSEPENTKSSFLEAIKQNADVIEFDVHLTKDKKIVVIHDGKIDRTSDGKGSVPETNYKELIRYNFGIEKQKEKILTLKEALNLIGNKSYILVELKHSLKGHEELVLKEIENFKYKHKVWIHSTHLPILKNIRRLNSTIPLGHVVVFSYFHHLLLPYYTYFTTRYKVNFFSIDELFGNKPFVRKFILELKKKNIAVYVWTVNDLRLMYKNIVWGADGIITNYPGILKKLISKQFK